MMTRISMAGVCLSFALCIAAPAQQDFSGVEISTHKVRDGIYMLAGSGGNIGLSIGADGIVMIDDQYAPLSDKILAAVAELSDLPIRFLINTHWHSDHTGGNESVGATGAVIVAHKNVRERMSTDQFIKDLNYKVDASAPAALPVVTFTAELNFFLNDDEIVVRHFQHAHTDGDAIILFRKANVIHAGDTYFNGNYPFIDNSSDGGIDGVIRAVDAMLAMSDDETRIIPGHGPLSDRATLVGYRAMLETVRARVLAMLEQGFTRGAALKARPFKDLDEKWGNGFIKPDVFVGIVYDDLAAK